MFKIGFSTGALAKGDLRLGIERARELKLSTIELSALRLIELDDLVDTATTQSLSDFEYVALHAPSSFAPTDEVAVSRILAELALRYQWPVIVHPDTISDLDHWRPLGSFLFLENMDKRKLLGRTADELVSILARVPDARICFDIAHARQVDSSMTEAYRILRTFRSRIRHLHFSEVGSDSKHRPVSAAGLRAYQEVASSIPVDLPVILEGVVWDVNAPLEEAAREVASVAEYLLNAKNLQSSFKSAVHS